MYFIFKWHISYHNILKQILHGYCNYETYWMDNKPFTVLTIGTTDISVRRNPE